MKWQKYLDGILSQVMEIERDNSMEFDEKFYAWGALCDSLKLMIECLSLSEHTGIIGHHGGSRDYHITKSKISLSNKIHNLRMEIDKYRMK